MRAPRRRIGAVLPSTSARASVHWRAPTRCSPAGPCATCRPGRDCDSTAWTRKHLKRSARTSKSSRCPHSRASGEIDTRAVNSIRHWRQHDRGVDLGRRGFAMSGSPTAGHTAMRKSTAGLFISLDRVVERLPPSGVFRTLATRWAMRLAASSVPPAHCCSAVRPRTASQAHRPIARRTAARTPSSRGAGDGIAMNGSVSVDRQLLAADLLDELHLTIHAHVVGRAVPPFDELTTTTRRPS